MGVTFGEKFVEALAAKKLEDETYGLRTLARKLADNDPVKTETVRRRLNKYRPPTGGGAAEVKAPTPGTRHEIEDALGLERDSLKPEPVEDPAAEFLADLAVFSALRGLVRQELARERSAA